MAQWQEGQDGTTVRYSERLLPRWWVWLVVLGFAGAIVIAYWAALGGTAALATAAVAVAGIVLLLVTTSPVVRVDDRVFRAGGARLPLQFVGRVAALDAAKTREVSTADPDAHLLLRMLSTPTTVLVEVTDEQDPHPFWLVSSAHPEELAAQLRAAATKSAGESGAEAAG